MMRWFDWCRPEPPTHKFIFKNGSTVLAKDFEDALDRLMHSETRDFWASETEPGIYEVQFEARQDPFVVVHVRANNGIEAARNARWIITQDLKDQIIKDY